MAKPQEVRLREFLKNTNLAVSKSPPWVHSTASSRLLSILQQEKLLAVKCNVFKKDKLCYLFVGRAAYKGRESLNPEPWQLPTVFVMRFDTPPRIKRIYPFDSGAFDRNKMPEAASANHGRPHTFFPDFYSVIGKPHLRLMRWRCCTCKRNLRF